MNVRCPSCETVYRVDPTKVPDAGIRARCVVCSTVISVFSEEPATIGAAQEVATPAPAKDRRTSAPVRFAPEVEQATAAPSPSPAPAAASAPPPPPAPPAAAPEIAPAIPSVAPEPTPRAPRPSAPVFRPAPGQPMPAPPVPPQPQAPAAGKPTAKRVNPFLTQDPKQKARRLARALVSDMIVYQPDKRQEALEAGNLKDAFEEEIQKSWEEYVEQVGKDVADSTDYFKDALNEILAGGQQIF